MDLEFHPHHHCHDYLHHLTLLTPQALTMTMIYCGKNADYENDLNLWNFHVCWKSWRICDVKNDENQVRHHSCWIFLLQNLIGGDWQERKVGQLEELTASLEVISEAFLEVDKVKRHKG